MNITQKKSHRYRTIDGMRGLAALAVVFYHLSLNLEPELSELLPNLVITFFSYGYLGVPLFFVISGLVISLSIKNNPITSQYAISFVIRRSVRLDPTYWATIIFSIALLSIKNQVLNTAEPLPTSSSILAHMFYLQDLLGIEPVISVVYWTLCLEVQLYLAYIFTVWLSQALPKVFGSPNIMHLTILLVLGMYSMMLDFQLTSISITGLFLSSWHYFLMGVLVGNVIRNLPYSFHVLIAWILIELVFQIGINIKPYAIVGVLSCITITFLWGANLLDSVLTGRNMQFLGKISYALYLIHPDVGWKVISLGKLIFDKQLTPMIGGFLFIAGVIMSIAIAYIFHLAFEKPSLHLSNKLKHTSITGMYKKLLS